MSGNQLVPISFFLEIPLFGAHCLSVSLWTWLISISLLYNCYSATSLHHHPRNSFCFSPAFWNSFLLSWFTSSHWGSTSSSSCWSLPLNSEVSAEHSVRAQWLLIWIKGSWPIPGILGLPVWLTLWLLRLPGMLVQALGLPWSCAMPEMVWHFEPRPTYPASSTPSFLTFSHSQSLPGEQGCFCLLGRTLNLRESRIRRCRDTG